jgi:hypothetical protein
MINLLVDEAYAFDYLSILQVKKEIDNKNEKAWKNCRDYLNIQLQDKFEEIINSTEYSELLLCNKLTFDAVEKARYGSITAKEVDECNMQRYHKKVSLQAKFFPKTSVIDRKT